MKPYYDKDGITIYHGDCREVCAELAEVDFVVTDPPYGLQFMGKSWDHGVPGIEFWEAIGAACKPGASLMAFGGTRTVHRLTCAIEDAGWEIRDRLMWLYASGFPKSHDVSKGIDRAAGVEREVIGKHPMPCANVNATAALGGSFQTAPDITTPATDLAKQWDGWGTALAPSYEPIIWAMKPIDGTYANNAITHGVAGIHVDGGRIGEGHGNGLGRDGEQSAETRYTDKGASNFAATPGPRGGSPAGRWPKNTLLSCACDGEHEPGCPVRILDEQSGEGKSRTGGIAGWQKGGYVGGKYDPIEHTGYDDQGTASRFFFCAKASSRERSPTKAALPLFGIEEERTDCNHPTVKPLSIMGYLLRLLETPTGGVILDPFMGSGSTLVEAKRQGRRAIGIELDEESCEVAVKRIESVRT